MDRQLTRNPVRKLDTNYKGYTKYEQMVYFILKGGGTHKENDAFFFKNEN